jgi:hypothetical protein
MMRAAAAEARTALASLPAQLGVGGVLAEDALEALLPGPPSQPDPTLHDRACRPVASDRAGDGATRL